MRVADNGTFTPGSHVAHDCQVGDGVVMGVGSALAGHVTVGDFAVLGSSVGVHRHCRIGAHAIVGDGTMTVSDVVPYGSAMNRPARLDEGPPR